MTALTLSQNVAQIPKSATLALNAKVGALRAAGRDIINFSVGEPDFPTPRRIVEAAGRAMDKGLTRYTDVSGILPLRKAIVDHTARDYGVTYAPDQVIVGCGGKQCLYNLFQALLNPNDEVLLPVPAWLTYPPQIILAHGRPVPIPTFCEEGFQVDPARVEAACTPRTRALLINSPSNPTGVAFSQKVLEGLIEVCKRRDLLLITDDLYYQLVYGDFRFVSPVTLDPAMVERTVIIGGVSKAYAMTGWRIGWAIGPKPLISAMATLQGQSTSNPCTISQYAALEALTGSQGPDELAAMVNAFSARRDVMLQRLQQMPGISCAEPQGAFYTFPKISAYFGRTTPEGKRITGSISFLEYLLEAGGVAGVAGIEFGADEHARFSYACSIQEIHEGMNRMEKALEALQ